MITTRPEHHGELISYHLRGEPGMAGTLWIAVFEYADCIREFDGMRWTVIPK